MTDTRSLLVRVRAAWEWLTTTSTRLVHLAVAVSVGAAATLWQISPWRDNEIIGAVLFWVAIAGLTLLLVQWPIQRWLRQRGEMRIVKGAAVRRGTYIERIVEMGRAVMGDGHADEATVAARLAHCPDGIQIVVRRPNKSRVREEVVGYLACWTISKRAAQALLSGEYESALDIPEDEFVATGAAAVYVTMVKGVDTASNRAVMRLAADRLRLLFDVERGPERLLARPATHSGELLMRKAGMKPVPAAGSVVWSVERDPFLILLAASAP